MADCEVNLVEAGALLMSAPKSTTCPNTSQRRKEACKGAQAHLNNILFMGRHGRHEHPSASLQHLRSSPYTSTCRLFASVSLFHAIRYISRRRTMLCSCSHFLVLGRHETRLQNSRATTELTSRSFNLYYPPSSFPRLYQSQP